MSAALAQKSLATMTFPEARGTRQLVRARDQGGGGPVRRACCAQLGVCTETSPETRSGRRCARFRAASPATQESARTYGARPSLRGEVGGGRDERGQVAAE